MLGVDFGIAIVGGYFRWIPIETKSIPSALQEGLGGDVATSVLFPDCSFRIGSSLPSGVFEQRLAGGSGMLSTSRGWPNLFCFEFYLLYQFHLSSVGKATPWDIKFKPG